MSEFTLDQLQALNAAIASGLLTVTYAGRTRTYQSTAALLAARDVVRNQLIADGVLPMTPGTNRGPASLTYFSRG